MKKMEMMKKNPMKQSSSITALSFVFFALSVFSQTLADLNSDRKALLHFAATVPHTKRLNWNASTPVCSSWIGVTCNSRVTRVISVRLPGVGLAGSIPENSLGRLDALRVLSLRSNMLNGNLPSDIPSIPSLQFLYLQRNNFSGEFPSSFSHKLVVLDLSSNSISGNIPTSLQNLTQLAKLKLQNNSLSGVVPNLNLPRLKLLNLSYNNLNGSIPNSLQKYPYSSFVGNSLLCGPPLKPCYTTPSPSPTPSPAFSPSSLTVVHNHAKAKRKLGVDSIIALAIGISAVLFLFALVIFIWCLKKRRVKGVGVLKVKAASSGKTEKAKDFGSGVHDAEKNKLFFFPGCSYSFDLEDLLRASAEILGKGNNGTTYKAVLDEGSTTVVVKRLKEVLVGKKEFEQQMEIVGRVGQHPNVAPLGAYYYSKDEKLLVYNYMPSGSLFTRLHGFRGPEQTPLNWDSRIKISLGAAKGIAHIHSEGGPKCIHGNIKSSNVLLDQDLEACIADFGLAPLVNFPPIISRILGYRAPEAIDTRKLTQKSDVYSFGVLLLEMLTGKIPIRYPGYNEVVDLPRWVRSVVREEWTAEVFDVEILRQNHVEEEMVQMLQIALACASKVPESRPGMEDVVKMIEEVRPQQTKTMPSSESDYSTVQTP